MFTDILWRFLILETFVLGALCSSNCSYDHPQKQFCTSEFGMCGEFDNCPGGKRTMFLPWLVEILINQKGMCGEFDYCSVVLEVYFLAQDNVPLGYRYHVEILHVFKGNVTLLDITYGVLARVVTTAYLHFVVRSKYYLFGRNENGSIYTDYCYKSIPFETPTHLFRIFLGLFYKYDCDCPDERNVNILCIWISYVVGNRNHNCNWVAARADYKCKFLFWLVKTRNRNCGWVKPEYAGSCTLGILESNSVK